MANIKLEALKAKYSARKLEALATLDVYLNNSVGIGEHPQIIAEMDNLIRQIADADGCLEVLNNSFQEQVDEGVNS